jgi:hypothetical protein
MWYRSGVLKMLSARASHSQMGKPLPHELQVPRYARRTYNHKIFWNVRSNKTADQFNTITEQFKKPCLRRYLDFIGSSNRFEVYYITSYHPPSIQPHPERIWTLCEGERQIACFTNVVEAWLTLLSLQKFGSMYELTLVYTDLAV